MDDCYFLNRWFRKATQVIVVQSQVWESVTQPRSTAVVFTLGCMLQSLGALYNFFYSQGSVFLKF